jgi:GNS1/SUR4 family
MVNLCYFFMLLKASYIAESVYGELANRPIYKSSYMHFHHICLTIMAWLVANFHAGGYATFLVFVNSFVHVFVDSYFLVAGLLFPALLPKTKLLRKVVLLIVVSSSKFQAI